MRKLPLPISRLSRGGLRGLVVCGARPGAQALLLCRGCSIFNSMVSSDRIMFVCAKARDLPVLSPAWSGSARQRVCLETRLTTLV